MFKCGNGGAVETSLVTTHFLWWVSTEDWRDSKHEEEPRGRSCCCCRTIRTRRFGALADSSCADKLKGLNRILEKLLLFLLWLLSSLVYSPLLSVSIVSFLFLLFVSECSFSRVFPWSASDFSSWRHGFPSFILLRFVQLHLRASGRTSSTHLLLDCHVRQTWRETLFQNCNFQCIFDVS